MGGNVMKKMWILIVMAAAIITSCGQEILDSGSGITETAPIVFNLTANHPDATKAVKTGWEAGDVIFVFFSGAAAPKHLKMHYDGSAWSSAEYNGSRQTEGALGLTDGKEGTMRAVYLPFGSSATVSADGTSFTFNTTYYAYYLTATLPYTVSNGKVIGTFQMQIPDDYVQFFVEDAEAVDEAYLLGCDAVIPVGVASIAADGTITETSDKTAADDMPGYAYSGGYLFSGKLNAQYSSTRKDEREAPVEAHAYYFAKTKTSDNTRADYFVSGKTLTSHSAVKLPANGTSKWQAVGPGVSYELMYTLDAGTSWESSTSLGKWYTCNYGCSVPEQHGTPYTFDGANSLPGVTLPTQDQFEKLNTTGYAEWVWLPVHGHSGMVVKASNAFLFLPAQGASSESGLYWSSTLHQQSPEYAMGFFINNIGLHVGQAPDVGEQLSVRPIQN